jgi:hypothetical protein
MEFIVMRNLFRKRNEQISTNFNNQVNSFVPDGDMFL